MARPDASIAIRASVAGSSAPSSSVPSSAGMGRPENSRAATASGLFRRASSSSASRAVAMAIA